jgi:hypothetical protein
MPLTATNTDAAMPPPEGPMTRTDANGHYTLKAPADITTLSFEAAGFQASYRPVQVQPDATVTVDVRLAPIVEGKFTLKGRVLAAPGGPAAPRPVPGATVYAAPAGPWDGPVVMDANRPMMVFTATTDRQGIYTFTLPAGAYTLSAQKDNFSSDAVRVELFRDAVQDLVLQTPVVVPMGGG